MRFMFVDARQNQRPDGWVPQWISQAWETVSREQLLEEVDEAPGQFVIVMHPSWGGVDDDEIGRWVQWAHDRRDRVCLFMTSSALQHISERITEERARRNLGNRTVACWGVAIPDEHRATTPPRGLQRTQEATRFFLSLCWLENCITYRDNNPPYVYQFGPGEFGEYPSIITFGEFAHDTLSITGLSSVIVGRSFGSGYDELWQHFCISRGWQVGDAAQATNLWKRICLRKVLNGTSILAWEAERQRCCHALLYNQFLPMLDGGYTLERILAAYQTVQQVLRSLTNRALPEAAGDIGVQSEVFLRLLRREELSSVVVPGIISEGLRSMQQRILEELDAIDVNGNDVVTKMQQRTRNIMELLSQLRAENWLR